MTARLTIVLGPDAVKALRGSDSIRFAAGSSGGAAPVRATKDTGARPGTGGFRAGSLPARLMTWAGGRKRPFGVPDLMGKFRIKRGHASMLIAYVTKAGAVRRVGRGEYAAA